jgi:hypothetical protein
LFFNFVFFFYKNVKSKINRRREKICDKEIENQKRKGTIFQNIKRLFFPKKVKKLLNNFPANISKCFVPNVSTSTS